MFKLRNFIILSTKWVHFKFDSCCRSLNSWVKGMFTIVEHLLSSALQNSLKTSGNQGYEFQEFWCWNLVPFFPDVGFQLLKSSRLSLTYFPFNDAPNVLCRWKIWTADRPIQHLDSSLMKPCCCNSCWNTQGLPWNRRHLEGSIQWSQKVFSQPLTVQVMLLRKMKEVCNFHHR